MFVCMLCFVTCKSKFFSDWQKIYEDEEEDDNKNGDYDNDDEDNGKDDDYDDNKLDRVVHFDSKFLKGWLNWLNKVLRRL